MFAGAGILMVGLLVLCWLRYWRWVRYWSTVPVEHIPDARTPEGHQLYWKQADEAWDWEDVWYTRYHWCLLLAPIFLGLAAFCAVLHWTEGWFPIFQILCSCLSGGLVLLGSGWLVQGYVREHVLPLEDFVLRKK
ncbi:hypothetical protein HY464_01540 [Candidatus Peregrinibacteria bacterium]|nr:hypothetical protein [Candidatus Peregrinibacteria bacterium]